MNKYKPLNNKELNEVWEKISSEMDVDEVWSNISSRLDIIMPENSGSGIIFRTVAAILIILIGLIPGTRRTLKFQAINKSDISIQAKQNDQIAALIPKKILNTLYPGAPEKIDRLSAITRLSEESDFDNKVIKEKIDSSVLRHEILAPFNNEVTSRALIPSKIIDSTVTDLANNILIERYAILTPIVAMAPEKTEVIPPADLSKLVVTYNSSDFRSALPINRGKISIGISPLCKNTWLLNKETFDGLKSDTYITTRIVLLPDVGLSMNYSLNNAWLLQADAFIYSRSGQKYNDYIYGHYSVKRITLSYSTLALSVKHKFAAGGLLLPGTSINIFQGVYFSVLIQADQKINSDIRDIGSQFHKLDLGLRIGGEIEMPLSENLSLAPGLTISFGIPSIYKPQGNIPEYLTTRIGTGSFHISFYYHFN